MRSARPSRSGAAWRRVAALVTVAGLCTPLAAQVRTAGQDGGGGGGGGGGGSGSGPALNASGRDFAGLLLELPTQEGGLTITARAAWAWTEDAPLAPSATGERHTLGAPVQRMFLKGDVRMQIGQRRLTAARAVVWIERIDDGTVPDAQALYQLAVYFDRVNNPVGASGAGATGDRLLLTARVHGGLTLASDAPPRPDRPTIAMTDNLVVEGEQRLARFLDHLSEPGGQQAPPPEPQAQTPPRTDPNVEVQKFLPSLNRPYEPGSPYGANGPRAPITRLRRAPGLDPLGGGGDQRLFSARGTLTVAAGQAVAKTEGEDNRVVVTGGVVLQYSEPARERGLQLSAQNAVIFLKPGKIDDVMRAKADAVLGIYLEGDVVATDNRFTLRAPYIYYDLVANQAYTVDAVFWTYDERRGLPLYVRADTLRQTTRNSLTAQGVTIAASSFYDPVLSLGASSVTMYRQPEADGGPPRVMIDGSNFTPRIGGLPFMWVPGYNGDIERFPLKDVRFESSSESGFGAQTRWDLYGLTGWRPPEDFNIDADLLLDAWFKRGIAVGLDTRWREADNTGSFLGYWVPNDHGTDVLTSGEHKDRDGEGRGLALYEHRLSLDDGWTMMAEGTSISDVNFVDAYFEQMAETRREFTSSLSLRHNGGNALFDAQVRGSLDNFAPNEYLLQSQGYTVRKVPELTYTRVADDLMPETDPGALLWTHEYRVGRVGIDYFKSTPRQLGYSTPALADEAFGLGVDQSFDDAAMAAGYTDNTVIRADTRHRVEYNFSAGPVRFQPYVVGRVTYYDDSFSGIAPADQQDQVRWWAGGGARASTQLQRVYDSYESAALDIHQLRHIVEPSVSFFSAGTNRHNENLPVFDYDVEGAQQGTAWRLGVDQTFQTLRGRSTESSLQRSGGGGSEAGGGAGGLAAGRVVDLFKWNVDYVNGTSDTNKTGPLGKWFEYRPEESVFGHFINSDAQLLLTDSTTLIGGTTYDLDINQPSRTTVGILNDHGHDVKTFAELRFLNELDSTFITFGGDYRLSALYTLGLAASLDTDGGDLQDLGVRINREFPDMTVTLRMRYNNLTGETTFGVLFTPLGRNRRLDNMRRLGRDGYLEPILGTPGPTDAAP